MRSMVAMSEAPRNAFSATSKGTPNVPAIVTAKPSPILSAGEPWRMSTMVSAHSWSKSILGKIVNMAAPISRDRILEPSAGKGDIIDAVRNYVKSREYNHSDNIDIDAVEIAPPALADVGGPRRLPLMYRVMKVEWGGDYCVPALFRFWQNPFVGATWSQRKPPAGVLPRRAVSFQSDFALFKIGGTDLTHGREDAWTPSGGWRLSWP